MTSYKKEKSFPNQHKKQCIRPEIMTKHYTAIEDETWMAAAKDLTYAEFLLWVYIMKDKPKEINWLSCEDFCSKTGMSDKSYKRAKAGLIEKKYAVLENILFKVYDTKENCLKNNASYEFEDGTRDKKSLETNCPFGQNVPSIGDKKSLVNGQFVQNSIFDDGQIVPRKYLITNNITNNISNKKSIEEKPNEELDDINVLYDYIKEVYNISEVPLQMASAANYLIEKNQNHPLHIKYTLKYLIEKKEKDLETIKNNMEKLVFTYLVDAIKFYKLCNVQI